ncbi:MAG: HAD-IIA family hydrolase, partial [Thermomicrobiales bacterium]
GNLHARLGRLQPAGTATRNAASNPGSDAGVTASNIAGFLIDVDGVLRNGSQIISGAPEALAWLREYGVPFRLLTNNTISSRASLAAKLEAQGFPVTAGETYTAASATANYVAQRFPGAPVYLLSTGDSVDDFRAAGINLAGPDGEPPADVVVIGGAEHELTYARLNHAYRLLLGGAKLIAMHRNVAWRTEAGMTLDSGPFIDAIARAAGVRTTTIGKPSAPFFRQAIRDITLPATTLAMIGDDARNDIAPARRLGLTGVLVRSGKPVRAADEAMADVTLASIAGLPSWLQSR